MWNSPIEEIKRRLDIVEVIGSYIKLQKAGANYRAVCPFHSEKNPSFFVSPARQIWHCFGACGEGGDIFKFVMKINGIEFGDALRILAQKAGVELKKEDPKIKTERRRLYDINEMACRFFEHQLENSQSGKEAKEYLIQRGLKEETIKDWRLGYAPDVWQGLSDFLVGKGFKREEIEKAGLALKSLKNNNYYDRFRGRIIFPIFDLNSQVIGFGGRIFKQKTRPDNQNEAKYVNIPNTLVYDKSRILYGLNKAGIDIRKKDFSIMVEGYMDAIMAHQAGTTNVIATSGTALTSNHLSILKRYSDNLFTAFDMDIAGDSATKRSINLAQSMGFNIKIVIMPEDKDPADVAKEPEKWQNLIDRAKNIHDFYFENTLSRFDKNTLEGKKEISKILLPVIKRIPNKIEQSHWVKSLAEVLEVKEEDIEAELQKTKNEGNEEMISNSDVLEKEKEEEPVCKKTRKELLEERLAILSIYSPKNLEFLKEEDFSFFSPQIAFALKYFRENGCEIKEKDRISEEQVNFLNYLLLKSEAEKEVGPLDSNNFNEEKTNKEFIYCLKEIKFLMIKDKLDKIAFQIKEAEKQGEEEKLQKLIKEFNHYSKQRCDLENA